MRVITLSVLMAVLPAQLSVAADEASAIASGKLVYLADGCFECHGRAGEGGYYNYPVPALAQIRFPPEAFRALVRAGPNDMPAYTAAVLSDAELADVYAFLRSLPGPTPIGESSILRD